MYKTPCVPNNTQLGCSGMIGNDLDGIRVKEEIPHDAVCKFRCSRQKVLTLHLIRLAQPADGKALSLLVARTRGAANFPNRARMLSRAVI